MIFSMMTLINRAATDANVTRVRYSRLQANESDPPTLGDSIRNVLTYRLAVKGHKF